MKFSYIALAEISFALLLPGFLQAQTSGTIAKPSGRTPVQVMDRSARLAGPYEPGRKLRLAIGLKPPKPDEEQRFLEALYTPGTPEYRKFLSAAEWNARFAPSAEDEQAIVDWAISQGLTITKRYPNRLLVDIEAPVSQIQKALGVTINHYLLNGAAVYSNDRDPVLPSTLAHVVTAVFGLNNIQVVRPHSSIGNQRLVYPDYAEGPAAAKGVDLRRAGDRGKLAAALSAKKQDGPTPAISINGFYEPTDLMGEGAYDLLPLSALGHCCNPSNNPINTTRETAIAILSFGSMKASDIIGFQKQYPYLAINVGVVNVDGTSSTPDGEGTLDVEWALAMGNSFNQADDTAEILLYEGANPTHATFLDAYNQILTDNRTRILSTSWGGAEVTISTIDDMTTENAVLNALAGQGWTLIAASDDRGSVADCQNVTVDFPASSPNVIAAGGTTLLFNSDSTYDKEVAWTGGSSAGSCKANDGGGGGGYSSTFGVPFYQAYLGKGVRSLPDLSLNASFPQTAFIDGALVGVSGTSIVAPELAGFFAQENAYLKYLQNQIGSCFGGQACAPIGNANYYIYLEQQNAPYAPHYPFYDIVTGCASNDVSINSLYYCAGPGYDLATGLGSFNMLQLAWAINYNAAGDFGPPAAVFSGATANTWYNQDRNVTMTFSDTTQTVRPATGVAGFSSGWDTDPAPESTGKATPGTGDAFYTGPKFPAQTAGSLKLSAAGQGCHTAMAKAWDNTGTSSGLLSYGPICYDTVAPVTTASINGTLSGGVYVSSAKVTIAATDSGSGVAGRFYSLDGRIYLPYTAPFTVSASGSYTLRYYSTDVAGNADKTRSASFTIKLPTTATKLTSSLNPSVYGLSVVLTASVTPSAGSAPTGTVTFKEGTTVLGTAALSNGKAALKINGLHAAAHAINATYAGSASYTGSSSPVLLETVKKAGTTTTVSSSANPSTYGKSVTLTATIAPVSGALTNGKVTFKDGNSTLGTGVLNTGTHKATFATTALNAGSHNITAVYGGSADDLSSTSSVLNETVNKTTTKTTLASSLNPAAHGTAITLTATIVPSSSGSVNGTVAFKDGATTLGSGAVNASTHKATFSTAALAIGKHSITAVYSGGTNFNGSTSGVFSQVVN